MRMALAVLATSVVFLLPGCAQGNCGSDAFGITWTPGASAAFAAASPAPGWTLREQGVGQAEAVGHLDTTAGRVDPRGSVEGVSYVLGTTQRLLHDGVVDSTSVVVERIWFFRDSVQAAVLDDRPASDLVDGYVAAASVLTALDESELRSQGEALAGSETSRLDVDDPCKPDPWCREHGVPPPRQTIHYSMRSNGSWDIDRLLQAVDAQGELAYEFQPEAARYPTFHSGPWAIQVYVPTTTWSTDDVSLTVNSMDWVSFSFTASGKRDLEQVRHEVALALSEAGLPGIDLAAARMKVQYGGLTCVDVAREAFDAGRLPWPEGF